MHKILILSAIFTVVLGESVISDLKNSKDVRANDGRNKSKYI